MRILVTGAAGYIGSALVRALGEDEVVATDQAAMPLRNSVVGNIAYPVRKSVASLALLYEPAPFTSPLEIPLAEPGATSAATTAPAP